MKRSLLSACSILTLAAFVVGCSGGGGDTAESKPDPNVKGRSIAHAPKMGMGGGPATAGQGAPPGPSKMTPN